jgi:UDP-N-acetylglucosamine acyltransferase
MIDIHKTAIISDRAEIGSDVKVGPYSIIERDVVVGDGCQIASNVLLAEGAVLKAEVQVHHGAVIGSIPQDLKFEGEESQAVIGEKTVVREYATINRGTKDRGETTIGKDCLIMAYAHVAHDCALGDNVILANSVNLAGHIEIDEHAIIGGVVPVHQFVKIGAHAMIGGGYRVQQDIVPYALAAGYPLKIVGLNSIGLKRRGFERDAIKTLEEVYKILFFSNLNTTQALVKIDSEIEKTPEVQVVLDFMARSNRGIVK